MTAPQGRKSEYCASIGDRDFYVTVETYSEDGRYNAGQTWVKVEEYILPPNGGNGWNRSLFPSIQISDPNNDLECIRDAFRQMWSRLRYVVRERQTWMGYAALEKGGKKAYYTRHANDYLKRIPQAAADWKLCKQIWKEITKL